jgi:hypothetical protein
LGIGREDSYPESETKAKAKTERQTHNAKDKHTMQRHTKDSTQRENNVFEQGSGKQEGKVGVIFTSASFSHLIYFL